MLGKYFSIELQFCLDYKDEADYQLNHFEATFGFLYVSGETITTLIIQNQATFVLCSDEDFVEVNKIS